MAEKNVGGEQSQLSSSSEFTGPTPPPPVRANEAPAVEEAVSVESTRIPVAEVNIRTMKDDIAGNNQPASSGVASPPKKVTATGGQQVNQAPSKVLPLQPKASEGVKQPVKQRKRGVGKKIAITLASLLLVVALGAGGWYAWSVFIVPAADNGSSTSLSAADVIAKDAVVVFRYVFKDPASRAAVEQIWGDNTNTETPLADAVRGNPALLAAVDSVDEVLYVLLPNNTRPFLLLPRTDETEQLFSTQSSVQVSTMGNWIIAHPVDAEVYEETLSLGSWAESQALPALAPGMYIQLLAQQAPTFVAADDDRVFSDTTFLTKTPLVFQGRYDANAGGVLFTSGADLISGSPTTLQQELLPLVPAQATFTRLGTNFARDLASAESDLLDVAVLQQPQVQQLISQLTGPYAYYRADTPASTNDFGLIVSLSTTAAAPVSIGDVALETGLRAMIPLLTGSNSQQVPQLAFADGAYQSVPLRYVNLVGQTSAIDYAIVGNYLLVASSKDAMFALIDTATQNGNTLASKAPWASLISQGASALFGGSTILASVNIPSLAALLPVQGAGQYPVVITALENSTTGIIQGVVNLSQLSQ